MSSLLKKSPGLALAAVIIAALPFAAIKPALAQDIAACNQLAWPIKREQALFASNGLQHVASGTTLDSIPDHGVALELQPHDWRLTSCRPGGRQRSPTAPAG